MGRTAKHNWQKLFLEYNQGRYKNVAEFAKKKGIYADRMRKEFRKLETEASQEQVKISPKNESKQVKKTGSKKRTSQKQVNKLHPWEYLKQQFTDWPEEKLQAYLLQLEARLTELNAVPFEDLTPAEAKELGQLRRERRAILSDPVPEVICSARRHDGSPCGNPVERGKRVCWNHGGAPGSGPPKGSKNALKHGAYETIWLDQLDDDEKKLITQVPHDEIDALQQDIDLLTIRSRRMMARIAKLTGEDFTVVKIKYEKGVGPQGPVDKVNKEFDATLGQVQAIERELTKVQEKRIKATEVLYKLKTEHAMKLDKLKQDMEIDRERLKLEKAKSAEAQPEAKDDGFIEALKAEAANVWADETDEAGGTDG
ncbi:MAG TPA: hypothetical protein DCZ10_16090 [Pelotomaculum sp.]|nr:hypothetical protein [Pelotomaculum sp.]